MERSDLPQFTKEAPKMPLPALPASNTERFKFNYSVGGEPHDAQVRTDGVSPSAVGVSFDAFLTALAPALNLVTISTVEYAAGGSNVFNIVSSGIEGNTYGSGAGGGSARANYVDFIGRSTGGRRVRTAIFGLKIDATDYKFLPGENAAVDAAIVYLQATPNTWLSIDNIKPVWYTYANAGVNAHWQKAVRP